MTLEANPDKVNLAKLLKDGMQVNVPRLSARQLREQTAPVNAGAAAEAAGANTLVSVKTAAESGRGHSKSRRQGTFEYGYGCRTDSVAWGR